MQKRPNSASNITRGVNRPALFSTGHSISIFAEKEKSRHVHTPTHQHLSPVALYGSLFINLQLLHLMDHPEFVKVKPVVRKKYRAAGDCHSSFFFLKARKRWHRNHYINAPTQLLSPAAIQWTRHLHLRAANLFLSEGKKNIAEYFFAAFYASSICPSLMRRRSSNTLRQNRM